MNAVGIDVSKGKSMVAIMRPFGEVVSIPFEIKHTTSNISSITLYCLRFCHLSSAQRAILTASALLPKDDITKLIIRQAVDQLHSASTTVESLRTLMNETASKLPEYPIVMAMKGVDSNEVILHSRLMFHVKAELTVHGFKLIT